MAGYYVIFNPNDGTFYGVSSFEPIGMAPDGYTYEFRSKELNSEVVWNSDTRDFESKKKLIVSKLQFMNLLSLSERIQIRTAAETDPILNDIVQQLNIAEFIDLSRPDTISSLLYLQSKNILSETRVGEILSG